MDLLTVTCFADKLQMRLQAESIQKFVNPCTHWVLINESTSDISEWEDLLSPYYTSHNLKLIHAPFISNSVSTSAGWVSQQVYKFYAYKLIQSDYLILDSKNFFIRPCSINEWSDVIGSGIIESYRFNQGWGASIETYSKFFNMPVDYTQLSVLTPFVFKKEVLDSISDFDKFVQDFISIDTVKSEFIVYSLLLKQLGKFPNVDLSHVKDRKFNTITKKYKKIKIEQYLEYMFGSETIKVAGLHRHFLREMTSTDKLGIISWIKSLGLKNLPFE